MFLFHRRSCKSCANTRATLQRVLMREQAERVHRILGRAGAKIYKGGYKCAALAILDASCPIEPWHDESARNAAFKAFLRAAKAPVPTDDREAWRGVAAISKARSRHEVLDIFNSALEATRDILRRS